MTPSRGAELDLRAIPIWERHPLIFARLDQLRAGETVVLINDHEPRPLRFELERTRPGLFSWSAIMTGNDLWNVSIVRLQPSPGTDACRESITRSFAFREAPAPILDRLSAASHIVRVERNAALYEQGDAVEYAGVVADGSLAVSVMSQDGRERLLYEARGSDLLNELAVFDGGVTSGRAYATSDRASVVLVPLPALRGAITEDASLARGFGIACAQRARGLIEHVLQSSESVVARLTAAILPYAPPERGLVAALAPLPSMTLADLAAASGSVREVVSRALTQIEETGAIERRKGRIVRVDRERLQRLG